MQTSQTNKPIINKQKRNGSVVIFLLSGILWITFLVLLLKFNENQPFMIGAACTIAISGFIFVALPVIFLFKRTWFYANSTAPNQVEVLTHPSSIILQAPPQNTDQMAKPALQINIELPGTATAPSLPASPEQQGIDEANNPATPSCLKDLRSPRGAEETPQVAAAFSALHARHMSNTQAPRGSTSSADFFAHSTARGVTVSHSTIQPAGATQFQSEPRA